MIEELRVQHMQIVLQSLNGTPYLKLLYRSKLVENIERLLNLFGAF